MSRSISNAWWRAIATTAILALLACLGFNRALAQTPPCTDYWIDTGNLGGPGLTYSLKVTTNWLTPIGPTLTLNTITADGQHAYTVNPPTGASMLNFSPVLGGINLGNFTFGTAYHICDPHHPGACLYINSFYNAGPPCFYEIHIFSEACPGGVSCP